MATKSTSQKKSTPNDNRLQFIKNCLPSRGKENDLRFEHAVDQGLLSREKPPRSVDLRRPWWRINYQGTTGSCVGWATADSCLRWHFVKSKKIRTNEKLSVRQLWMGAKEMDADRSRPTTYVENEGTTVKAALDIARKFGVVKDKTLPFKSAKLFPGTGDEFYERASALRIEKYFSLCDRKGLDIEAAKRWLATHGPIAGAIEVDVNFDKAYDGNANLLKWERYKDKSQRGGHAIALVGYDDSAKYFILRNSWGTWWADKGYAYLSYAYAKQAFYDAYGVIL